MSCVDVVIPCYNYARFLKQAVDSALSQRGVDVRVLIIDDKSSDETPQLGAALAAADPRVTFRRHEENQGHIKTFNEGILGWVEAEYYTLISADDALSPGSLARAVAVLNAHPEVHLAYGKAWIFDEKPLKSMPPDPAAATYCIIPSLKFLKHNVFSGNPAPSPAVVLRTAEQKRLGGYHQAMTHTSDMEMWMRFASQAPVAAIADVQGFYRVHEASMSVPFFNRALRDRQEVIDTCEEVFGTWCQHIPETKQWLDDLKRRYSVEAYWLAGKAFEDGIPERMRTRLAFARKYDPNPLFSAASLRFRMKTLLGRKLWTGMLGATGRGHGDESAAKPNPLAPAQEIGWWPEPA
jgi:glycosyltransferase involved in cell wall biosynthesis